MASHALAVYEAAIDELARVPADAKATLKAHGEQLYVAAVREAAAHIRAHLDAETGERADTAELRARAELIRAILERAIAASDNLALSIASGLDG